MQYYLSKSITEEVELDMQKDYTMTIAEIISREKKVTLVSHSFDKPLHIGNYAECFDITKTLDFSVEESNQYPVIQLDFKDVKGSTKQDFLFQLYDVILKEYLRYVKILNDDKLPEQLRTLTKQIFLNIMKKTYEPITYQALGNLSDVLYNYYDKEVLIFIDHFHISFNHVQTSAYREEGFDTLKQLLGETLEHNTSIKHALLTVK